mmetsp:Transcript_13471/g.32508  ORF Transcript_13471/g.32508 Transcript_13471/m.32508 type:complete len:113 (-) Transcript_13471:117-455(-)
MILGINRSIFGSERFIQGKEIWKKLERMQKTCLITKCQWLCYPSIGRTYGSDSFFLKLLTISEEGQIERARGLRLMLALIATVDSASPLLPICARSKIERQKTFALDDWLNR